MKYAHIFSSTTERDEFIHSKDYKEPFVCVILEQDESVSDTCYNRFYDPAIGDDLMETPLTAVILSAGNFTLRSQDSSISKTIEYKKNSGSWTSVNITTAATNINVEAGDKLSFRGNNDTYAEGTVENIKFDNGSTCKYFIYGNIMSLITQDNFGANLQLLTPYTFSSLFANASGLTDASNLILPATYLSQGCYSRMFYGTSFRYPPKRLPATNLPANAYTEMFAFNEFLEEAPILDAKMAGTQACYAMFSGCKALDYAPSILIGNMSGDRACEEMFKDTGIKKIPYLGITMLSSYCCAGMFAGCKEATEFPFEMPYADLQPYCYANMFSGCTNMVVSPKLLMETPANYAYSGMFRGCTALTAVTCYLSSTANNVTSNWLADVVPAAGKEGYIYKNPAATYSTGNSGIPTGWDKLDVRM